MHKNLLPEDLVPKSFMDRFGSLIKCALGGWDRLRFHASLHPLFSPKWMRTYLCVAKVRLTEFKTHAQALTHRLVEEAKQAAARADRPYLPLRSSKISKEELVEQIAQRDRVRSGLIAVLGAVEPCVAMSVQGTRERRWLEPVRETRKCLHLYHYYEHPVVGRCHVRVQTWYPFSVDVCLNGRLWLAKQMTAAGLGYRRADNCFLELADPARAQALADAQHRTNWLQFLNGLLDLAHPLRQQILKPFPRLFYYWTVNQSEFATDLIFRDSAQLARVYRSLVLHGLCTFQSPDIMRFLGHRVLRTTGKVDARFQGEVRTDVIDRHEGVCLKHRAGINSQKAYDKFATLLRVENTINRPDSGSPSSALFGKAKNKKAARQRSAAISRKLRLLRAHGLIRKVAHTHRYLVTESGRVKLTALVAAQHASTEKLTVALAA